MNFNEERQIKVLDGLSKGISRDKIAHSLRVSSRTIDRYIDVLKVKHEASTIGHLVGIAFREKLIK